MSLCLKEPVLRILNKTYEPDSLIDQKFGRYDLSFKTDDQGRPVLLFMGHRDSNGHIKGERYARRLAFKVDGHVLKDHWEHKGKST